MNFVKKMQFLMILTTVAMTVLFFQNCSKTQFATDVNNGTAQNPGAIQNPEKFDVCPLGPVSESSKQISLSGDCQIIGSVNLTGTATITMSGGVLKIQGAVRLSGDSKMIINNGGLSFPQTDYDQFSLTLNDRAQLKMKNSTLTTNATQQNNFSMNLEARDSSLAEFENSTLNSETGSWLLGNFHNSSQLNMIGTQNIPTEIYPSDSSKISITSGSNFASVWLEFLAGSNGTINIPAKDSQENFNFSFGPSTGIAYTVNINASKGRLGLNSHPNSTMVVNGNGLSGTNDAGVVFGYYVENNTSNVNINGLTVGNNISRQFTDQGRNLQLNHVNLNPFSWQLYVNQSNGFLVSVTNSILNEVGVLTNGHLDLSTCILQLAILGAHAPGSKLNVTNSQIWSQAIQARNGGELAISNSQLHGNFISATGAGSKITLTNTGEAKNGVAPQSCAAVNGYPPNVDGSPLCNPFNPLYQCSQVSPPTGGATITATPSLTCP